MKFLNFKKKKEIDSSFKGLPFIFINNDAGEGVGVIFYALGKPKEKKQNFPLQLWHEKVNVEKSLLHGDGWECQMFTLEIKTWPSANEWEEMIYNVSKKLLENNVAVFMGDEVSGFSDVPWCFEKHDVAFTFLSEDKWFFNAHLDRPFVEADEGEFNGLNVYLNEKLGLYSKEHITFLLKDQLNSINEMRDYLERFNVEKLDHYSGIFGYPSEVIATLCPCLESSEVLVFGNKLKSEIESHLVNTAPEIFVKNSEKILNKIEELTIQMLNDVK